MTIITYGKKHGGTPFAHERFSAMHLRNPHKVARMRSADGRDPRVREYVVASPAVALLVESIVRAAGRLDTVYGDDAVLAIYCYGGKHRSVAIAEHVAPILRANGIKVAIDHRDVA